jgi:hypothetical protein
VATLPAGFLSELERAASRTLEHLQAKKPEWLEPE